MQQTPVVDDQSHEQGPLEMVGNCFSGENHISLDPVVHTQCKHGCENQTNLSTANNACTPNPLQ
jgi:hypothetical protein